MQEEDIAAEAVSVQVGMIGRMIHEMHCMVKRAPLTPGDRLWVRDERKEIWDAWKLGGWEAGVRCTQD